ncbi:MAG: sensor histidine kinase [Chloroflexia bacterium]|nr:sensor histidine kinase [Chloroflexia bacterium]
MTRVDASAASGGAPDQVPPRVRAWALMLFALASIAIGALGQLTIARSGDETQPPASFPAYAFFFLAFTTFGALIVARRPRNAVGWLLYGFGLQYVPLSAARTYAWYALVERPGSLVGGEVAAWVETSLGGAAPFAFIVFLFLLFPTGHLPSARWRPLAWLVGLAVLLDFVAKFAPGPLENLDLGVPVTNPFGLEGAGWMLKPLGLAAFMLMVATMAGALVSIVQRLRRAVGSERQQLKWLALSGTCIVAAFAVAPILWTQGGAAGEVLWTVLFTVAVGTLPAAVGVALLRHRLFDIDLILSRALVYSALTAAVVGVYALVVGGLGALLQAQGNFAVSLLAAGLVALLFQPLRDRVQRAVNRLLYGDRDDPYAVLSRLGRRLEEALAPEAVLPAIVRGVADALRLPYAAIALPQGGTLAVVAATGTPIADPTRFPLTYRAEPVGELLLAPRAPGETFGARDRRLLEDLARQIGVAAHAVRLTAELQLARERLVTAREEERRRLRRDLHDGLGAQLAALSVQTSVLHKLVRRDPAGAEAAAIELRLELQAAVADIRRLVHGLRPPALDELGLVAALRQRAAQYATGNHLAMGTEAKSEGGFLDVVVEAPPTLPNLPAAVEVAVYRIVEEALTNVVRHARARRVVVRLAFDADLRLTVEDDGVGIATGPPMGVGLSSMRERAAELGGEFAAEAPPGGGTRVEIWLPLPMEA